MECSKWIQFRAKWPHSDLWLAVATHWGDRYVGRISRNVVVEAGEIAPPVLIGDTLPEDYVVLSVNDWYIELPEVPR